MATGVVIRRYHEKHKALRAARAAERRATDEAYAKAERVDAERAEAAKTEASKPKVESAPAPVTTPSQPATQPQQHNRNHRR